MTTNDTIFYLLDANLDILAAVDIYQSAIFTRRYQEPGDFELYIPATQEMLDLLKATTYVTRADDTSCAGILEKLTIQQSAETGDYLIASGPDLSALLNRRIVWRQTTFSGYAEKIIRNLVQQAFIEPEDAARTVSNMMLAPELGLTAKMRVQYTGDPIGDSISAICKTIKCGYRVNLDLENKKFVFELYQGTDRSYNQSANPYVVFSSNFENLLASTYSQDAAESKNVAQVAGEGQGNERVKVTVGTATGINRRETFVDALQTSANGGELDLATYRAVLYNSGSQSLADMIPTEEIDGEVIPNYNYTLGVDYFLGDVVEVVNDYGTQMSPRVTEVIENWATDGYTCIPTFSSDDE